MEIHIHLVQDPFRPIQDPFLLVQVRPIQDHHIEECKLEDKAAYNTNNIPKNIE